MSFCGFTSTESTQLSSRSRRAAASAASTKVHNRIDTEMLRWDRFLRQFVQRYVLDDTQTQAAYSIARECKQRALEHRDRYRARLATLEKSVGEETEYTPEQSAEFKAMYGPIDALFAEMKTRIDQIPTTEQVATAEEKEGTELRATEKEARRRHGGTEGKAETTAADHASSKVDDSVEEKP